MTRRYKARPLIVIGAVMALMVVVLISFTIRPSATEPPADPGTLTQIAKKNDAAAMNAAIEMREDSRRAAEAADAHADFNDTMREP